MCRWRLGLLVGLLVTLGLLVVGCGGGGGGGGSDSGGEGEDTTLRVTALSAASSVPFGLITVTGQGFDVTAETYVQFADASGSYAVSVPAVGLTSSAVTASVPPYFDSNGSLGSETVSICVVQAAGGKQLQSAPWDEFQILELPETGLPPGTVTLDFSRALASFAEDLETQITGTALGTAGVQTGLARLRQAYADLALQVQAVMEGSAQSLALGALGSSSLAIGLPQLADADRMLVAIVGQTGDAQVGRVVNPTALLRGSDLARRQTSRILALGSTDYTDCLLNAPESGCSTQRVQLVTEATATAFNRAYQVIAGTTGVVLGTMTLTGAPAMATALSSAALSYVQLVGGGGLIAVGGVLNQSSVDSQGIVQQGVNTFNSFLQGMAETVLGTFIPATEKPLAVKSILEGGSDLWDAFGVVDLDPEPTDPGTGLATYSSSFTGTTVEVSSFATLTYEIIGAVTTTLEGGAGTMIDPYQGTLVVEGTVFVDCTPNLQGVTCENTSAPFWIEGPVGGLTGSIAGWAGGDTADQSPAVFQGGVLSGDELSGEFTFDVGCYWECAQPIVKPMTMIRMP